MKNILTILLLFISLSLAGQTTYYIRADGNDSNTGLDTTTITAYATWQKGVDVAVPGDTIYIMDRGGVFYPSGLAHNTAGSVVILPA